VNLPNAITIGRIAAAPFVGWLPFVPSWSMRLLGFVLFLVVAISDYYDGKFARSRNAITDLGKQLDPLADKLFLIATLVPMYVLMNYSAEVTSVFNTRTETTLPGYLQGGFWFVTPFGSPFGKVGLPIWVLVVILGREVLVTILRQMATRRGVTIAAIRIAKWKTGFQFTWVGAAYFWFFAETAARTYQWQSAAWTAFEAFNGIVGVLSMAGAIVLTLYSLAVYVVRYRAVFADGAPRAE
jgi:phosphatidylglycerophosphate synthase